MMYIRLQQMLQLGGKGDEESPHMYKIILWVPSSCILFFWQMGVFSERWE